MDNIPVIRSLISHHRIMEYAEALFIEQPAFQDQPHWQLHNEGRSFDRQGKLYSNF
jgi:hypothetical protein